MTRSALLKRAFDVSLASAGLIVASPVMGAIWWRIRRDGDGPILYRGLRAGRGGTPFQMYKFRTMRVDADRVGGSSSGEDDPRITRTGSLLRRYKADELPQLLNVLKGDMSLVGPRPQVLDEVAGYSREEREILRVRPGITDWASIRFSNEGEILRGHPDPDRAYASLIRPEKMELGLKYVREATFLDDLRILRDTFAIPLRRRPGSYTSVTERWGTPATAEQLEMAHFRYQMAADLAPGGDVLEIGCGAGMGLAYLATRTRSVVGCDVTDELVAEARSHLPGVDIVVADATSLPFPDAQFDAALLLEMLYYVQDQDLAVAEAFRVVRPGGAVMVCAPNPDRPAFNPSPMSTRYPGAPDLAALLRQFSPDVEVFGAFAVAPETARDRRLDWLRQVAVRLHLIPRSMRGKAVIKRLVYGSLARLGPISDDMAPLANAVKLDQSVPVVGFKNLYAIGRKPVVQSPAT